MKLKFVAGISLLLICAAFAQSPSRTTAPQPVPTPSSVPGSSLGCLTAGMAEQECQANKIDCWKFQATGDFNATIVKALLAIAPALPIRAAIYSDNNGVPGDLLVSSIEIAEPKAGWAKFKLPYSVLIVGGTNYWIALNSGLPYTLKCETSNGISMSIDNFYGPWPQSLSTAQGLQNTVKASINAIQAGPVIPQPSPTPAPSATTQP